MRLFFFLKQKLRVYFEDLPLLHSIYGIYEWMVIYFEILLQNNVHIHQESFLPLDPSLFPASTLLTFPCLYFIKLW